MSGKGLHVFFMGEVRGHALDLGCVQYWNPDKAPRFFALTGDMLEPYTTLRNVGKDFNYIFATAGATNAKLREELKEIDPEQWAVLPVEKNIQELTEQAGVYQEKQKHKTRVVKKDFDLRDYLTFNKLKVVGESTNEVGHCLRVDWCPIKGEAHAGHNNNTTNFMYPTKDGGLAFHCQSTGCNEKSIHDAIKLLAERNGVYPKGIYEEKPKSKEVKRVGKLLPVDPENMEHVVWLWPGYIQANQLTHLAGASAEGKSPVCRDIIARLTSGREWPDGTPNTFDKRMVIMLCSEDDWNTVITPHLKLEGANFDNIKQFVMTKVDGDSVSDAVTALDQDVKEIEKFLIEHDGNVGLVYIDPITNYLGKCSMNAEDEMRGLLMPVAGLAQNT